MPSHYDKATYDLRVALWELLDAVGITRLCKRIIEWLRRVIGC